jgi:hypothetical protein
MDLSATGSYLNGQSNVAFTNLLKFADIVNNVMAAAPFSASLVCKLHSNLTFQAIMR